MDKKRSRETIAYGLIAALLLALLAAATLRNRDGRLERQQVRIVAFGDSVFGLIRDGTGVPDHLERLLGESVFNAAFGGTCISRIDQERRLDYAKDSLSLVGLSKAVAADDFGVQQTARIRESNSQYFPDLVDELERIDFTSVELVLIQHGLNDYYSGVPLKNDRDPYDEYTFQGALRSAVRSLRQANPNMRIVLITPTYTWHRQSSLTCEEFDAGYGVQEDYIRAEMEVAEEMGVELLDLYHDLFPHDRWEDWEIYTRDGLHPNEAGCELLAEVIADYLRGT